MAKTKTSTEVKNAWKQHNYKQYNVSLRFDTDGIILGLTGANRKQKWEHFKTYRIFCIWSRSLMREHFLLCRL